MRFPTPGVKSGRIRHVVSRTDDDGEETVQILWKSNSAETHQKIVEFLRRRAWALKNYTSEVIGGPDDHPPHGYASRKTVKCAYTYGADGMPLLKSRISEKWFIDEPDPAQLKLERRTEVLVAQCIPGPAPPEVFDVDVLLGKKRSVETHAPRTNWLWLLLNGVILLALGTYLLRRTAKGTSRPPSTPIESG